MSTVARGSTITLTATANPATPAVFLSWSSSDPAVAGLTPSGDTMSCVVLGEGEGTAMVTATVLDANGAQTASVATDSVTVTAPAPPTITLAQS